VPRNPGGKSLHSPPGTNLSQCHSLARDHGQAKESDLRHLVKTVYGPPHALSFHHSCGCPHARRPRLCAGNGPTAARQRARPARNLNEGLPAGGVTLRSCCGLGWGAPGGRSLGDRPFFRLPRHRADTGLEQKRNLALHHGAPSSVRGCALAKALSSGQYGGLGLARWCRRDALQQHCEPDARSEGGLSRKAIRGREVFERWPTNLLPAEPSMHAQASASRPSQAGPLCTKMMM
jgi:hypothetical protein